MKRKSIKLSEAIRRLNVSTRHFGNHAVILRQRVEKARLAFLKFGVAASKLRKD